MSKQKLPLTLLVLLATASSVVPEDADRQITRFRLIDAPSGKPTTAMVCIRDASGAVRLPPHGRVSRRVSLTSEFYRGLKFDPSSKADWIGPVRKMAGRGDNNDRSYVYEERPSVPYWREPVMYQTRGEFSISLPAGKYTIAVARGMEYVPVKREFQVSGKPEAVEKAHEIRLERWVDLAARGWYSGDVHVHHPTLEEVHRQFLLHYAAAEDLRVVNVLEMGHHKGTDFRQERFGKASRVEKDGYWLVSGQEEPRSNYGHIIGLNISALARDVPTYDFYDLAFKRIHAQKDALVGFAHFSWNGCALPRGFPWYVTTGALDFIELMQFGLLNASDYHDYLNLGFRLTAAAGSDVPWGSTIGEVRTYVWTGDSLDLDRWFANLRAGHTFVSNGPALELAVDGELPGSELRREPGARVRVRARAWGHPAVGRPNVLELITNDGVHAKATGDSGELKIDTTIELAASRWITVAARAPNGAAAHATPVYVVIGGRPTWSASRAPAIVRKQLDGIDVIAREVEGRDDDYARGIRERLERARTFYAKLLAEIEEWKKRQ